MVKNLSATGKPLVWMISWNHMSPKGQWAGWDKETFQLECGPDTAFQEHRQRHVFTFDDWEVPTHCLLVYLVFTPAPILWMQKRKVESKKNYKKKSLTYCFSATSGMLCLILKLRGLPILICPLKEAHRRYKVLLLLFFRTRDNANRWWMFIIEMI